jgi:glycine betaine transporter
MAASKYGKVKLGQDEDKPKYSFLSWLSMLFSAGMGIGLIFWGVAEPLNHYINPLGAASASSSAKIFAMKKSFLHWGISAWACYSVLALILAYYQFRKKKPALLSSVLIPIIGEKRAEGALGKFIDICTIFATSAGVITSLGLGTLQINAGLNYLFHIPENLVVQLLIIGLVTIVYTISATAGLDSGIQKLSNLNMILAAVLLILAIMLGPTFEIFQNLFLGLKSYAYEMIITNNNIFLKGNWYEKWTIFYWGWWIAWAPPVGIFIARISKGRTIREFLLGVLLVPSLLCFVWFAAFGTIGFNVDVNVAAQAIQKTEIAFFMVMNNYPLGNILSGLAILLLSTFFVTSADSATFVLGMISSNGDLNPKMSRKVVWGFIQAALTIVFLVAGGLKMIQTVSIIAAFPFSFIILFAIIAMKKSLKDERIGGYNKLKVKEKQRLVRRDN